MYSTQNIYTVKYIIMHVKSHAIFGLKLLSNTYSYVLYFMDTKMQNAIVWAVEATSKLFNYYKVLDKVFIYAYLFSYIAS